MRKRECQFFWIMQSPPAAFNPVHNFAAFSADLHGRGMGVVLAARKSGYHDFARHTSRRACQSDPAPKQERQRVAGYIPRWGIELAAHSSENTAWAIYRDRLKRFGSLIGDREPIVLHKEIPGMGRAKRYIITIADDDRGPLDKLCRKLIAADATCDVLRNPVRTDQ